jgi:hypothetical protein
MLATSLPPSSRTRAVSSQGAPGVREGHVGHHRPEGPVGEAREVGGVPDEVLYAAGRLALALAGARDHPFGAIHRRHVGTAAGHATGEVTVAAGHLQHAQTANVPEHPLEDGVYECPVPAVALCSPCFRSHQAATWSHISESDRW